jgi:hypothetical protein
MAMEVRRPTETNDDVIIGDTLIRTLRKTYGAHFAEGCRDDEQLRDVLNRLDEPSLCTLIYDQQHDKLDEICRQAV